MTTTRAQILEKLKAFGMTNHMLNEELLGIGKKFSIDVGHLAAMSSVEEDTYYPQFDAAVRTEAAMMSKHYETFYCLERSIRTLVSETLETAEKTPTWWQTSRIPPNIKAEVAVRILRDVDSGMTRRSSAELDYTTFGELGQIITSNWDVFGSLFDSRKAVEKVMANLNYLRGPIAHCSPLAEEEALRLQLTVGDWFRLTE